MRDSENLQGHARTSASPRPERETSMARKPPTARDIERVLEETVNVMVAAQSDVTRWIAAAPAAETAARQGVGQLLVRTLVNYEAALRIVRADFVDEPLRYPRPPVPLHRDGA